MFIWGSIILVCVGLLSSYLISTRRAVGWYIGMCAQPCWFTYAIVTNQWGFVISSVVYFLISLRAAITWTRKPVVEHHKDIIVETVTVPPA